MQITEVTTAFKIADVEWIPGTTSLRFVYLDDLRDEHNDPLPQSVLTDNFMRVYLIVVNGEIRKIGGSQDKGGMKSTLRIYQTGGKGGRPSIRSFGVWYFLYHEVVDNKANVEFYMIYQPTFAAKVKGLFGYHDIAHASLNYKLMEECCERDYQSREGGGLPEWNMQEAAKDWPHDIKVAHARLTSKSTRRHTLRGRSEGKMQ